MPNNILCGPCGYEDNIKHAKKWCTNCDEGFCEDCEKVHRSTKISRNHTLISVSDYEKIKDISISQTCVGHGKRYDLYCSVHDKPLCIDCVDQHKSCSQLVSLDAVAANAKQSTAFADLEDTINGALKNIGKFIKNQETKGEELTKQESLIKKNIQERREKLNQYLDHLEQKLIQDLSTKSFNWKSEYGKVLNQLNLADQKLSQLKKETETIKQLASDIQVFLGTRELNNTVSEEIKSIKAIINSTKYYDIKIDIDSSVTSILDLSNQFGMISLVERKSEFEFKDAKLGLAQKQLCDSVGSSNRVVDLQIKQKIRTRTPGERSFVRACLLLPDGNILIQDILRGVPIMEWDEQGRFVRNISCSTQLNHLTLIDIDRIAATYSNMEIIDIIHLRNQKVHTIKTKTKCEAIFYQDGKLFVVQFKIGIVVYDISGEILNTLAIDTRSVCSITTTKDRIYYTTEGGSTIHCLNMTGQELWVYQNDHIKHLRGIAAVNNTDVLVIGCLSNNLSLIKDNGQKSNILLSKTDGLINPRALSYNKDRNELLICNRDDGSAAVYKVILG